MKHIHCITLAISMASAAYAQNVGIGTSTPGYRLDIVGRARIQAGTLGNASTGSGIWFTDNRTNADIIFVGMADSVNYGLWSQRPGVGWQFFFDARYGNVGIGRRPSTGTQRLALDHPDGASLNVYANGGYRGGFQATDTTLEIFGQYGSNLTIPATTGKDIIFWPGAPPCPNPPCLYGQVAGRVGMYTNAPNARVHIVATSGTGGVLIGSAGMTPATGYMLNVAGKAISEEVKVQLNGSWPDYVFEDDYPMPSLETLEQHVMDKKHLPGIPTAGEVQAANGFELGATQQKMLEKIEELYRYLFQLNARMNDLADENARLKKLSEKL